MIFQSSMGPKYQGVTVPNGTTQGKSYPIGLLSFVYIWHQSVSE
jgi:hypothetical protein